MLLTQRECTFLPHTSFWVDPILFPVYPLCFCLKSLFFPPFTHLRSCFGFCSQEIMQWFLILPEHLLTSHRCLTCVSSGC